MSQDELDKIIENFELSKSISPVEFETSIENVSVWVRFKIDPKRFTPSIFLGDWAFTNQHPVPGKMKIVRAMTGQDGIARLVARQGKYIYAYPWFR